MLFVILPYIYVTVSPNVILPIIIAIEILTTMDALSERKVLVSIYNCWTQETKSTT